MMLWGTGCGCGEWECEYMGGTRGSVIMSSIYDIV